MKTTNDLVLNPKSPKDILNELSPKFEVIKPMLDAYPKAFTLEWSDKNGFCLSIDLDMLNVGDANNGFGASE